MSKELLKKCRAAIEAHCVTFDPEAKALLMKEIDAEIKKSVPISQSSIIDDWKIELNKSDDKSSFGVMSYIKGARYAEKARGIE